MLKKNTEKQVVRSEEENSEHESLYDKVNRLREESKAKEKKSIPIERIHPFADNPYKVLDNEEMDALVTSINERGIFTPLMLRPRENVPYEYDIISGHRRFHAAKKAGLETVPAFVFDVSRDEAAIMVVDSNLHREHILPSEKAFGYKLKLEALKHQGATSRQVVGKLESADMVSDTESGRQVQRYIRLTYLIPELLELVDEDKIALTPAVELSYLTEEQQYSLLGTIEEEDRTPSLSQAVRFKKLSQTGELTDEHIETIMQECKANQKEMFKIPIERLQKAVPDIKPNQLEDYVIKACEYYKRYLQKKREMSR